jgi:hypothetical protein
MPFYGTYPRFCAACGTINMVSATSPYRGEVCGAHCWAVLEMRQIRALMGKDFDFAADQATCEREEVQPITKTDL